MAIIEFSFNPSLLRQFVQFAYEIYKNDAAWIPPLKQEVYAQLSPQFPFYQNAKNSHRHFLARDGAVTLGRASAFVNSNLRDNSGEPIGTIGFFECVQDIRIAHDLLDAAANWLRQQGIQKIWGPMNFDIWHGYRFMTKGFEEKLFYGEPYNKPYYPEFFERYGFVPRRRWDSSETSGRAAIQKMIDRGREQYQQLIDQGYRFEEFDARNFRSEIEKLRPVLCSSFNKFPFFSSISRADFYRIFEASRYAIVPRFFRFVYDGTRRLIGFAAAFLELSDPVRSMKGEKNPFSVAKFFFHRRRVRRIMFHLGGYLPDPALKHSGLGRATFSLILQNILQEGYETVLNTLMAERNTIHGLLLGQARIRGEYTLYELCP
ncbi:MAG: hypothetical protein HY562_04605 [Ignavibacteriales bacterium]|nr:hypothetical protein [Ignavibacteriales bacterium]